ncbi:MULTISPECIES: DUF397 domain-containing protein [Actinomadura]|uniref:DUF397 domain-containing protein n=1 Tax=Actinomadura yumaensis TaxID=111807 RepID=A0ABW2CIZ7_9ACTN|nr:DUF397 domain-containing protein [Actinomadura sp. J1-007]MWK34800.1 DUF397 domain-containing protein [Actinomadura sp. J1-007]
MTAWRKSSYSQGGGATDCVEVAGLGNGIGVRDSKAPDAGHLTLSVRAFVELLAQVKEGRTAA